MGKLRKFFGGYMLHYIHCLFVLFLKGEDSHSEAAS